MDNDQTQNNQNGISGFTNTTPIGDASVPNEGAINTESAQPVNPAMPDVPKPNVKQNSVQPVDSYAGLSTASNFANQSIVGGVEEPKNKPKQSLPFINSGSEDNFDKKSVNAPVYNEITAGGQKNKFALIAILAGLVVLLAAGGGYYYYFMYNTPEPEPVVEQPEVAQEDPQPVFENTLPNDPFIQNLQSIEASDPTTAQTQINNINIGQIDIEIQQYLPQEQPNAVEDDTSGFEPIP